MLWVGEIGAALAPQYLPLWLRWSRMTKKTIFWRKNSQNCPSFWTLDKNDFQSFRSCRTYQAWVKVDLKCNLEITFHWKHPLPKTKWENKIWWKCKNIFLIWHFSNLAFSSLLWNIISAVFTKRLKIDVFNHFHFKKMLFLRPLRQPTHRSSLLEMFCCFSTPH